MDNYSYDVDNRKITESRIEFINEIIREHVTSLSFPLDSWLEDRLFNCKIYKLYMGDDCAGYAGIIDDTLHFFYVKKEYFRHAPVLFEKIVEEKQVKRVFIMTQDTLLCALISEWEYEKVKQACWFTDGGKIENTKTDLGNVVFRTALTSDIPGIRKVSGDFFDDASGGFSCLEERIEKCTVFILENSKDILGCGIVEKGQICTDYASIGMFVNPDYRKMGAARTILLKLKEWAYANNIKPVAGCWYYNTLSRKSLESAGMIVTSTGFDAILMGKEKLPLRTGNPPGELV